MSVNTLNTTEILQEATQTVIAIMVVVADFYAILFTTNVHSDLVSSSLGLVLGWYFTKSVVSAQRAQQAQQAQQATPLAASR